MVTFLYSDTTIAPGQTVTFTEPERYDLNFGVYALQGPVVLTILGSLIVQDTISNDIANAVWGADQAVVHIGAGGSISVYSTGSGGEATGVRSGANSVFQNDGTFFTSGVLGQSAVNLYGGTFSNTNSFTATATNGPLEGLTSAGFIQASNSGDMTVSAPTANGIHGWGGGTINNSGTITVTSPAHMAVGILAGDQLGGAFTITNTGTITADTVVSSDGGNGYILLTNSGALNGDVLFGFEGGDQLHNTGTIHGLVHYTASSGQELYDGRGGYLTGAILFSGSGGVGVAYLGNDGETVTGGGGALIATGGSGNDTITGGSGNDTLDGGAGSDLLDGGGGINTLAFRSAPIGVTASLALQGSAQATGVGVVTASNFQNLLGSAFADHLTGDANNNVIDGGGGDDLIDGGGGRNTLSFASATTGVAANLSLQGMTQATGAGSITATNFQNLLGSAFADHLTGDANDNTIDGGGGGDDVLDGGLGANTVSFASAGTGVTVSLASQGHAQSTGAGSVTFSNFQNLTGSAFNDTLEGDANNNVLNGGAGTNTISYAGATSGVTVGLALQGQAQNTAGAGTDTLSNFQNLIGSTYADHLTGDAFANLIDGRGGDDVLDGGGGVNTVTYATAANGVVVSLALQGQAQATGVGSAVLSNFQNLTGSAFNDILEGDGNKNVLDGGAGVNTVSYAHATSGVTVNLMFQGGAQNTIGAGTDTLTNFQNLTGSAFDDTLAGNLGNNVLDGGAGTNTVSYVQTNYRVTVSLALQGQAQDTFSAGIDTLVNFQNLTGSGFDDILEGDGNNNVLDGAYGNNTVTYAHAGAGVAVSLMLQGQAQDTVGAGTDTLYNFQNLTGSAFNDTLEGDGNDNVLDGGGGTNTVSYAHAASGVTVSLSAYGAQNTGGAGTDTLINFQALIGSAYNDTLTGSPGTSSLTGGAGADTFKVTAGANTTITDFSHAQGDKIDLTALPQFTSVADVVASATQVGANTVVNTGSGLITLNNVTATSLAASDFAVRAPPGFAPNDPHAAVCYITDVINGIEYRASGVIIGPHTVLTSGHVVFDPDINQSATNIVISPGHGPSSDIQIPGAAIHYGPFTDDGDQITRAQSQSDFAIIDVAQNLSPYGWYGIDPTFSGGPGGISGFPATAGDAQRNTTGALTVDPSYTLIDYSSQFAVSGGSSGGPIWIDKGVNGNPQPYVVGTVSTAAFGAQITTAVLNQIKAWVSQDTGLWIDLPGQVAGSGFDDHLVGDSGNNVIDGKGGNDTFTGGGGTDTFVFETGGGHNEITDFSLAEGDRIDLSAFAGLRTLLDVQSITTQQGANAVINLGGGASVTLDNVQASALGAANFALAVVHAHPVSDFNGDGVGDLLWRDTSNGDVGVWLAQSTGSGVSFAGQNLGPPSGTWQAQSVGDFNGDGQADILWIDARGEIGIWSGHAGATPTFTGQDLGPLPGWHFQATGDVNADGRADILWRGDNGDVGIWTGQSGAAPSFSGQDFGYVAATWQIIGTGDFNGDGKADILWTNANGDVGVWASLTNGNGGVLFVGQDLGPPPLGWHAQAIGDFDGDGKADILWRNDNGEVGIWQSQSVSTNMAFNGRDLGPLPQSWHFQDLVDVNGDGRSDIVWRGDNGDVGLWYAVGGTFPSFNGQDFGYVAPNWHIQSQWVV